MSIHGNYAGGIFSPPVCVTLASAAQTDIVTAADNNNIVGSVGLANDTGASITASLHFFDGATNWLVYKKVVPANDTVVVENIPIRLRTGYKIKATGAANLTVSVYLVASHTNAPS